MASVSFYLQRGIDTEFVSKRWEGKLVVMLLRSRGKAVRNLSRRGESEFVTVPGACPWLVASEWGENALTRQR